MYVSTTLPAQHASSLNRTRNKPEGTGKRGQTCLFLNKNQEVGLVYFLGLGLWMVFVVQVLFLLQVCSFDLRCDFV